MRIRIGNAWDKAFSIILAVTIVAALGIVGYTLATPKVEERLTEFYILGLEGKAIDYPRELWAGREEEVRIGIVNREYETVSYRLEVIVNGVRNNEKGPLVLEHNEKWEEIIGFVPNKAGDNQKVEFLLYKNNGSEPYRKLYLWIKVKE